MTARCWPAVIALVAALCACGQSAAPVPGTPPGDSLSATPNPLVRSLSLASLSPRAPTSPPGAVEFGRQLFFDEGLSANGRLSCASCHEPALAYTDGVARSVGLGTAMRNAPTLIGVAYSDWFYWDGRKDSLWSQALLPLEAGDEMGSSRVQVLRYIAAHYRGAYESLYGALPAVLATLGDRPLGPYGDPAARDRWNRLPLRDREAINNGFANVGRSLAAFEATLLPEPTRFDRYAAGDTSALSSEEQAGLALFLDDDRTRCLRCHNGPLLTNQGFHNIGTGVFTEAPLDFGRSVGIRAALFDEFNCHGPYARPNDDCAALDFLSRDNHTPLDGAFKVPTLRYLTLTAPFFHDGRAATLEAVVEHYRQPPTDEIHELLPIDITEFEKAALVAFLRSLSEPEPAASPAP